MYIVGAAGANGGVGSMMGSTEAQVKGNNITSKSMCSVNCLEERPTHVYIPLPTATRLPIQLLFFLQN